jgi:hypothetical protein
MNGVREMRRRNGAHFWELFHDSADRDLHQCFMDESCSSIASTSTSASPIADQAQAKQYLVEGTTTVSSHWLADRQLDRRTRGGCSPHADRPRRHGRRSQ